MLTQLANYTAATTGAPGADTLTDQDDEDKVYAVTLDLVDLIVGNTLQVAVIVETPHSTSYTLLQDFVGPLDAGVVQLGPYPTIGHFIVTIEQTVGSDVIAYGVTVWSL